MWSSLGLGWGIRRPQSQKLPIQRDGCIWPTGKTGRLDIDATSFLAPSWARLGISTSMRSQNRSGWLRGRRLGVPKRWHRACSTLPCDWGHEAKRHRGGFCRLGEFRWLVWTSWIQGLAQLSNRGNLSLAPSSFEYEAKQLETWGVYLDLAYALFSSRLDWHVINIAFSNTKGKLIW